jgi:predicted Fe-Mo cluster-binding NifX family protein
MDNGLDSPVSGHFGHCKAFIVATINNGEIVEVETVPNLGHTSCADPVNYLAGLGVNVLITMGMGMKPFMAAQQAGLVVVRSGGTTVGNAVRAYLNGVGKPMDHDDLCGGSGDGPQCTRWLAREQIQHSSPLLQFSFQSCWQLWPSLGVVCSLLCRLDLHHRTPH